MNRHLAIAYILACQAMVALASDVDGKGSKALGQLVFLMTRVVS